MIGDFAGGAVPLVLIYNGRPRGELKLTEVFNQFPQVPIAWVCNVKLDLHKASVSDKPPAVPRAFPAAHDQRSISRDRSKTLPRVRTRSRRIPVSDHGRYEKMMIGAFIYNPRLLQESVSRRG